jgi:RHS repeat-associated protein
LVNDDGTMRAINRYDEYGAPQTGNVGRFQYTGQAWIPELAMSYYKARIYSTVLGRFLQVDPTGYDDQLNLYAYVADDPINRTDPDGLQLEPFTMGRAASENRRFEEEHPEEAREARNQGFAVGAGLLIGLPVAGALAVEGGSAWLASRALPYLWRDGRVPTMRQVANWAERQGFRRTQSPTGPVKYIDRNGVARIEIKQGSPRTPGSELPHIGARNPQGNRIDPRTGNRAPRSSPESHAPVRPERPPSCWWPFCRR